MKSKLFALFVATALPLTMGCPASDPAPEEAPAPAAQEEKADGEAKAEEMASDGKCCCKVTSGGTENGGGAVMFQRIPTDVCGTHGECVPDDTKECAGLGQPMAPADAAKVEKVEASGEGASGERPTNKATRPDEPTNKATRPERTPKKTKTPKKSN